MKQNDSIAELKEAFIAQVLRRFVAEQLATRLIATGRPIVPESEAHELLDEKYPDVSVDVRRLIVRSEFDRLERAAVIETRRQAS